MDTYEAGLVQRIEEYKRRLCSIFIPPDPSPADLRALESELDLLYTNLIYDYTEVRTRFEDVQRSIEIVLKGTYEGKNDKERTANAYQAARAYPQTLDTGELIYINLFELESRLRRQYNVLYDTVWAIKSKSDRIITLRSTLNIEKDLI